MSPDRAVVGLVRRLVGLAGLADGGVVPVESDSTLGDLAAMVSSVDCSRYFPRHSPQELSASRQDTTSSGCTFDWHFALISSRQGGCREEDRRGSVAAARQRRARHRRLRRSARPERQRQDNFAADTRRHHATVAGGGDAGGRANGRPEEILELLEIDHLAERFPHELSSGQQQLFHLSMVLVRPSSILLLDEPEQRLDPDKRDLLTRILLDRKAKGTGLLIACHDPAMTEALAETIVDLQPA